MRLIAIVGMLALVGCSNAPLPWQPQAVAAPNAGNLLDTPHGLPLRKLKDISVGEVAYSSGALWIIDGRLYLHEACPAESHGAILIRRDKDGFRIKLLAKTAPMFSSGWNRSVLTPVIGIISEAEVAQ